MDIKRFEWNGRIVQKIIQKHGVFPHEVEEIFQGKAKVRAYMDIYHALGVTSDGKYLFVVFRKRKDSIKVITARPMTESEKRLYGR